MAKTITRFPPSPTGYFHIGSARTALFNYLFTKKEGGEILLRFEDTDKARNDQKYEEDILEGLKWLGIDFDGDVIKQSERGNIYKEHLQKLIDEDKAYFAKEEVKEEGQRSEVIRFRNKGGEVVFQDIVRGEVKFDVTELRDFIIAKSIDEPVYHFAVVVDDALMGVSHVIRGEDHISNTPRQILILEALGFKRPLYAHIPLILAPDRSKLSKRFGAVSITDYREMGYLPEALVNYLALLGWNPGDEREVFTMDELIKEFSLERVQKGGAIFNIEKLDWINKQHLEQMSPEDFKSRALEYLPEKMMNVADPDGLLSLIRERINKFGEITQVLEEGELDIYIQSPEIDPNKIIWKEDTKKTTCEHLQRVVSILERTEDFSVSSLKEKIQPYADEKGRGNVLHPMRFSLSGKERSPDPYIIANIIGKSETIKRLNRAIKMLS